MMKIAREIVGDRGEIFRCFRSAGLPFRRESVRLWIERVSLGNSEQSEVWVIGFRDLLGRAGGCAQGKGHVGLPRGNPDLADHHIFNNDRFLTRHFKGERPARSHRFEVYGPMTAGIRVNAARVTCEADRDLLRGIRVAPDTNLAVLLQDHVVAEQVGEYWVCRRK